MDIDPSTPAESDAPGVVPSNLSLQWTLKSEGHYSSTTLEGHDVIFSLYFPAWGNFPKYTQVTQHLRER